MKTLPRLRRTARCRAYASLAMVASVAIVLLGGLSLVYRGNIRSHEVQARTQVKLDFAQKEEAVLRALLHVLPNRAMGAMMEGSSSQAAAHSWEGIFAQSIQLADAEQTDFALLGGGGGGDFINANSGDGGLGSVTDLVAPVAGSGSLVNAGSTHDGALLFDPGVGEKLPPPLTSTDTIYQADRFSPVISPGKTYHGSWTQGVHLPVASFPVYNRIDYPDIRFGYGRPGEPFVAKRNWWAFSLTFGKGMADSAGVPPLKKNYVVSIYEVPSQLPLSSGAMMTVGQHGDGSAWRNTQMSGGIFSSVLRTEGTVALPEGLFSARRDMDLGGSVSVGGSAVRSDFNDLGIREQILAGGGSAFHEASMGGDVGRAVFVPITRGLDYFSRQGDGIASSRISPTGWNAYTSGAAQCQMRLRITRMKSITEQQPTRMEFRYRAPNGANNQTLVLERGVNWPEENEPGGDAFPFQTEYLPVGRHALIVHPELLPPYLASLGNAGGPAINRSLYIYPDRSASTATIKAPSYPSDPTDMAVVLRRADDLSPYTAGLSLVTNCRLYIGDSVNTVPIPAPAGAGVPADQPFYPPLSLYATEKRFGTSVGERQVSLTGQITSAKDDEAENFRPLDMKTGSFETIHPDFVTADLKAIVSPAQLPPVFMMNWLLTIEEIQ